MIKFPVLHKIKLDNYQLYEGTPDKPGLDHTFQSGVNVIVGINGLGKTTLLNILLRAITGPFDYPFGELLGNTKRTIIAADRSWFRKRVSDDATAATVYTEFWIGEDFYGVKRSLHNLDLLELTLNQQSLIADNKNKLEDIYQKQIKLSSNLSRFDDFIFLLRYLVFFLEDRRSLVWDPSAQAEALSILFGEGSKREIFISNFNDLASLDSQYRNTSAVLNKYIKYRENSIATLSGGQIDMLVKDIDSDRVLLKELGNEKQEYENEREDLRNAIENSRREAFDRRSRLAKSLDGYYESFFPNLHDAARYLLSHFDSGSGCLVCGTDTDAAIKRVKAKLDVNICPICESPLEHGEEEHLHDPFAQEAIEKERNLIDKMQSEIGLMENKLSEIEDAYSKVTAKRIAVADSIQSKSKQLEDMGHSSPAIREALEKAEQEISSFNIILANLKAEIDSAATDFRELANGIDDEVKNVSKNIENKFAELIRGFLAEDCKIVYTTNSRSVGVLKNQQFPFPHFLPALTSGVFREGEMVRQTSQSVSESQREFIDLAFRMAIMEIAAPDSPTMLILETPEASLDSVFIPRAANLLRRFATKKHNALTTRLIASSNVNRELMIPALFGVYPDKEFEAQVLGDGQMLPDPIPIETRSKHVLDLLSIAAPTRALEAYKLPYEKERDKAIYPERYSNA